MHDQRVTVLRLHFKSPMRIKHQGQYILNPSDLHPQHILLRLYQRMQNYCRQHGVVMPIDFISLKSTLEDI